MNEKYISVLLLVLFIYFTNYITENNLFGEVGIFQFILSYFSTVINIFLGK